MSATRIQNPQAWNPTPIATTTTNSPPFNGYTDSTQLMDTTSTATMPYALTNTSATTTVNGLEFKQIQVKKEGPNTGRYFWSGPNGPDGKGIFGGWVDAGAPVVRTNGFQPSSNGTKPYYASVQGWNGNTNTNQSAMIQNLQATVSELQTGQANLQARLMVLENSNKKQ